MTQNQGPISIVIPAHNEEKVIARCLRSLTEGAAPGELEVIVACNGCTDRTAEIARGFGPPVKVVETATPSKTDALNLGDDAAAGFPRFYVDADVVLTLGAVREVAAALRAGPALAAAPRIVIDLEDRPWHIRAYYKVWTALPYWDEADGQLGSGVYALSEAGRRRWDRFPKIIADDGFVDMHFKPGERITVKSCEFYMKPPRTLAGLVKIFTRVRAGSQELRMKFPNLPAPREVRLAESARRVLRSPSLWPGAPVYAFVVLLTKWKGRRRVRSGKAPTWSPEQSSRADSLRVGEGVR